MFLQSVDQLSLAFFADRPEVVQRHPGQLSSNAGFPEQYPPDDACIRSPGRREALERCFPNPQTRSCATEWKQSYPAYTIDSWLGHSRQASE